jgi:hypothetical protein
MGRGVSMLAVRDAALAARLDMLIVLGVFIAAGFLGVGLFRLWRWHDRRCQRLLKELLDRSYTRSDMDAPVVKVMFHTYRGVLVFTTQQEHRFVGPAPWALEWLDRLHAFNLRSNWKNPGSFWVPLLSWGNRAAQRRSVRRQVRAQQ